VSCSRRRVSDRRRRALEPDDRHCDGRDEGDERGEQHELAADAAASLREEQRQQHDRRDLGNRRAGDHDASERRLRLARVFEDRQDDPEPCSREDDRDHQRRTDEAGRVEAEAHDQGERERERKPDTGQPQHAAAQTPQIELDSGEKEKEGESDEREHANRFVHVRPAQDLRPDHDPEQDLEHDRREPDAGQRERERREHGDRRDDRHRGERRVQGATTGCAAPGSAHSRARRGRRPGAGRRRRGPRA
jgi:transcription termination factor Rho